MKHVPDISLIVKELVEIIESNYPIPIVGTDSLDFEKIEKIIDEKLNQIEIGDKKSSIETLIYELKKTFKLFKILDERHLQCPSYSISIQLKVSNFNHITVDSFLRIKISLLAKYYVIFYEDINTFQNLSAFRPLVFRAISSQNKNVDAEKDYWNTVIAIINNHFHGYKFIDHSLLFNSKTKGFPYKSELLNQPTIYPLYDFLFDNEYKWGNLEIAL